jgi:two-component system NtrC family sensor kinase
MDFIGQVFGSGDFRLHGYYYLWDAGLVWLDVISDSLIAGAYFSIPAC